jgi:polysaccharide pyruvyl transferase WcaK-like protein
MGGVSNDDHRFLRGVLERDIAKRDQVTLVGRTFNGPQTKWIIGQMAVFAGARTHSTIAALSSRVPTLSFSYSIKAKGINRDVYGHTDYCLPPNQLKPETVVERIEQLLQQRNEVKAHLEERIVEVEQLALKSGQILKDLLSRQA